MTTIWFLSKQSLNPGGVSTLPFFYHRYTKIVKT